MKICWTLGYFRMPVRVELDPPPPANSEQPGINTSLLYSGSKFQGHQKSKGNCYDVEVALQVSLFWVYNRIWTLNFSNVDKTLVIFWETSARLFFCVMTPHAATNFAVADKMWTSLHDSGNPLSDIQFLGSECIVVHRSEPNTTIN